MAIKKVKLPNNTVVDINDSRIPGVDSAPTSGSTNVVTSGGVKTALDEATVTESTVSGWGFTKNTGTLTGVKFNGTSASVSGGVASITATIPSAPGTLITNATSAQTASSGEAMSGSITLHKVAKTGTYSDLIGKPTIPLAAWFNQTNTTMYWFASAADKASFIADQTQTSLVLFSAFVDLVLKRIILTDSAGEDTKSTTEDQTTLSITVDFVEQEKPIAGGAWEDNDEGAVDLTVYVDTGNTGTYTQLGTTQHFTGPDDYTVNVRSSLVLGTNKVKIECALSSDSTVTSSIEYTVTLLAEPYIVFADTDLEAFLANKWGDGIGLTKSQAASVTSFGRDTIRNTSYTSFNEFQYFTGLTSLETYTFRNTQIKSLTIPPTITAIPNWFCYDCQLNYVTFTSAITSIGDSAFRSSKIISIEIPASVTNIGNNAFYANGNTFVTAVVRSTTPPSIGSSTFGANNNLKIYVPYSSDSSILNAYKTSWSNLSSKIYELNQDGTIPTS